MFDNLTNREAVSTSETATIENNNAPVASQSQAPATDAQHAPAATTAPAADNTTQQQQPNTPAPDAAQTNATTPAATDFSKFLDEMSGGLFKSPDDLKAALPQIKEYGTLKKTNEELVAKMAQAPVFADDEVRILNELKAKGATRDQLKTFQTLNEYGNLAEMSDKDALVASLIMGGTKPSTAELKVNRDFDLENEDLDPADRELKDEDLRLAGIEARKKLEDLKAKVSDATQLPPEEAQLQLQAKTLAHAAAVKPYVGEIVSGLPHLGVFTLAPAKDGAEAVSYTVPVDDSTKAKLAEYVENYFMDGLVPVTQENTLAAMDYARFEIIRNIFESQLQAAYLSGVNKTTEALVNKYENRSGLRSTADAPIVAGTNDAAATANFATRMANRTL